MSKIVTVSISVNDVISDNTFNKSKDEYWSAYRISKKEGNAMTQWYPVWQSNIRL